MSLNNPYANYKNNSVYTATPEELTMMLYDGALKFANQALVALERKDLMKTNELIQRTSDIIEEFQITLDRKYEISNTLDELYVYIKRILYQANVRKDTAKLTEAIGLIRSMRDMWKEAMLLAKKS